MSTDPSQQRDQEQAALERLLDAALELEFDHDLAGRLHEATQIEGSSKDQSESKSMSTLALPIQNVHTNDRPTVSLIRTSVGIGIAAAIVIALAIFVWPQEQNTRGENSIPIADEDGDRNEHLSESKLGDEISLKNRIVRKGHDFDDEKLIQLIEQMPNITHLTLDTTLVTAKGLKHLPKFKHLKHLSLAYSPKVENEALQYVAEIEDLRSLNLRGFVGQVAMSGDGDEEYISPFSQIGDEGIRHFSGHKNLRELNLGGTRVTDKGLGELLRVGALTKLERLNISYMRVSPKSFADFDQMPELRSLNMFSARLDANAIRVLRANAPQLRELGFGSLGMGVLEFDEAAVELVLGFEGLERLEIVSTVGVPPETMARVGELKKLRHVRLHDVQGVDNRVIAQLATLPKLQKLELIGQKNLSSGTIAKLAESKSLQTLSLRATPASDEALHKLGYAIETVICPDGDLFAKQYARIVFQVSDAHVASDAKVAVLNENKSKVVDIAKAHTTRNLEDYIGPIPKIPKKMGVITFYDSGELKPGTYWVVAHARAAEIAEKKITIEKDKRCDVLLRDETRLEADIWEDRQRVGWGVADYEVQITVNAAGIEDANRDGFVTMTNTWAGQTRYIKGYAFGHGHHKSGKPSWGNEHMPSSKRVKVYVFMKGYRPLEKVLEREDGIIHYNLEQRELDAKPKRESKRK